MKIYRNITILFTAIVCLMLFGIEVVFVLSKGVSVVFTEQKIEKIVEQIDMKELITGESSELDENMDNMAEDMNVMEEDFIKMLNSKQIKELVNLYLLDCVGIMKSNHYLKKLTKEKVLTVIEENIDGVLQEVFEEVKEEQKTYVLTALKKNVDKYMNDLPTPEELLDKVHDNAYEVVSFCISDNLTWMFVVCVGAIIVLIALLRWHCYSWLMWTGIVGIVSAITTAIAGIFIKYSTIFMQQELKSITSIANYITEVAGTQMMWNAAILLVVTMLQIIIYFVLRNAKQKTRPTD